MAKTKPKKAKSKALKVAEPKLKPGDPHYVIYDKVFGEFTVKFSANAWWVDRQKVELLINAFKYDATVEEACISVGISRTSLYYFLEIHPDFSTVMEACREVPALKARQHVVGALGVDLVTSRWYLERKKAGEFGQKPPVVAVQINMAERMAEKRKQYE